MTPEEALAHPTWSMGPKITIDSATLANKGLELIEAHFLFGLPYERIEVVVHPTSIVHALVRFRDGASLAHLGYPDMRVPISFALTYPERAATPVPAARPRRRPDARVRRARPRDVPAARARARGRRARRHLSRARSTRRTRSPSPPSSRAGCRSSASPRWSRRRSPRSTAPPARDLDELVEARRGQAPRGSRNEERAGRMNILVAILGLAFLILIHEAGHFFAARGGRDAPAHVLPRASRRRSSKTTRNGIEYGIGAIPLGGYVKIPGMHRPAPSDLDVHFGRRCRRRRSSPARSSASSGALAAGRHDEAPRRARRARARRSTSAKLSPAARRAAERGLSELDDALGRDAYWRQRTWKRSPSSSPARRRTSSSRSSCSRRSSWSAVRQRRPRRSDRSSRSRRRPRSACRPGDQIVAINGMPVGLDATSATRSAARRASRS